MKTKIFISLIALLTIVSNAYGQEELSLEKALSIGLKQNFDIEISRQSTSIAETANTWGMAGRYPSVSLNASSFYSGDIISNNSKANLATSAGVGFNWLLFGGMRVNAKKNILNLQHNLAIGTEQLQVENTIKSIILAYNAVIIEKKLSELYSNMMTLSEDRYNRDKIAYSIGGADTYALVQSESAYLSDKKRVLQQERSVKSLIYQLNTLLNVDIESQWVFETEIDIPQDEYSIGTMKEMMLANNTTIKNQYVNQQIAQERIRETKSYQYPNVSLQGNADYRNFNTNGGYSTNTLNLGIGATVSFNIFNGSTAQRNVQISELNSKIAELSTQNMELFLTSELLKKYDTYTYTKELVELGAQEVRASKTSLDLSYEKFTNGSISSFDFRQVQLLYFQSIFNQMSSVYVLIESNTELIQMIGGLTATEE